MTGLVFLHGWGYGPLVWDAWAKAFADRPMAVLDAGYFGPPQLNVSENSDGWVGVGHSLGFARLLSLDIPWRGMVGLCGFLRFCHQAGRDSGTPPELLDAMLARLDAGPADVLRRFTRRCGQQSDCPAPPADEGLERLRNDLLHLRGLDLEPPEKVPPCLLVHAKDDRIVPLTLVREAQSRLPNARLEILESGGHALPFTRAADCLRLVQEFLHGL